MKEKHHLHLYILISSFRVQPSLTKTKANIMHSYQDGTGKWHSQYIELVKSKSAETLRYVIEDCKKAIQVNPESKNNLKYLDEILYCSAELKTRKDK